MNGAPASICYHIVDRRSQNPVLNKSIFIALYFFNFAQFWVLALDDFLCSIFYLDSSRTT